MQRSDYLGIARSHIDGKNWLAAYRFLEDVPDSDVAEAKSLMIAHPEILRAGLASFSPDSLNTSIQKYGIVESQKIEQKRLEGLRRYASIEEYNIAERNILNQYDKDAIAKAKEQTTKQINLVEYGRIVEIQADDRSRYNTGAGASIGQAYGSARYIDRAFSGRNWNYNAVDHVNSAIIGAVVGDMIEGKSEIEYHVLHWIRLMNGELISLKSVQRTHSGHNIPVGTCVKVSRRALMEIANDNTCKS